jgi:hypothetical protein
MSLADLRKELKELRKKAMPTPVSRMKKADCAAELARLRGHHAKEEVKVAEVLKEEKVAKPVAKKVQKVQKESHKKEEESVYVPSKSIKAAPKADRGMEEPPKKKQKVEEKPKDKKPAKGSEEMRERMRKLREMRKAKKDE